MHAIAGNSAGIAAEAERVRSAARPKAVLPRFLRRAVRSARRIDLRLPRFFGLKSIAALFVATALAGVFVGGNGATVLSAVTAWAGFAIENVKIAGQSETSEVDVLAALDIGTYPSLLTLDVESARDRIQELPWVREAGLKKLFPDTVEISIVERAPFATWQHDGVVSLVDAGGKVIATDTSERYNSLPHVVGAGAAARAGEYAALVAAEPAVAAHARAGILVSGERWTIALDNGIELMLPSADPAGALATIATLDRDSKLLSREIAVVDLRQSGQMVVRLTPAAAEARAAMLKQRDKAGRTNT